jgi:hypothetical protein
MPQPRFSPVFKGIALRARKLNVAFIAVAQRIADLMDNVAGAALIKQSRQFALFANDKAEDELYRDALGATEAELRMIKEGMFGLGYWSVLIKRLDGQSAICRFDLSEHPEHLAVLSATPKSVVFDPTMHAEQLLGNARRAADALKELQQLQQQYAMLRNQYEAIAHLPQTITNMGRSLITTPTLQNPFPQSYQLQGILSGNSLGPVDGVASGFRQMNTYYEPKGDDPAAVELRRRADSTSGIQALATNAMHSLEQRAAALKDFIGGISLAKQAVCQNAEQADFAAYAKRKEREVWGHGR